LLPGTPQLGCATDIEMLLLMAPFLFTSDVLPLWHYGQSHGKEPSKEFVYKEVRKWYSFIVPDTMKWYSFIMPDTMK
jgi:hypothetical protein